MTTSTGTHTLGDPQTSGAITIFPIFGPESRLDYRPLAEAIELGATVRELATGADVRTVVVDNSTDMPALIYEGEQIKGAQQNRVFDSSFLIPAKSQATAPVSCVERGRWDHSRQLEPFEVSDHSVDPAMRGIRREQSNQRGGSGRPDQSAVWSEVSHRLDQFEVASSTDALEDLYAARAARIEDAKPIFAPCAGQLGTVVQLAGRPVTIDLVSRAEAFGRLAPGLIAGYALHAGPKQTAEPNREKASRFLRKALEGSREQGPNIGLGHSFTVSTKKIVAAGVEYDDELVALSAFRQTEIAT
jgi:hypothetical protein